MQHIKKKTNEKQNGKICTNKEILIYPKYALKHFIAYMLYVTSFSHSSYLTYKVAVDNCSISMNK